MNAGHDHQNGQAVRRRDLIVAGACGVGVGVMVAMSYAAVPLYNWFCRATGFNGTTQVATSMPTTTLDRVVTVRFDANVSGGLPWKFEPEVNSIDVKLGEVVTVNYKVTNFAARPTVGQAAYNVTPLAYGSYFQKINCFCFTEQSMKPGETREMAVVFYVDPAQAKDSDAGPHDTITLSYTFYPVRDAQPPVLGSTQSVRPNKNGT
jgi:cytochrome c oxidase assembly protein subunit 11